MNISLRREYARLVTSGAQLILVFVGVYIEHRLGWLICLTLIAGISVFAWASAYRRARAITDTPTSKIASAAQGYVELRGLGKPLGAPLISPLKFLPCIWFRFLVEVKNSKDNWTTESSGESDASFIIDDGTGQCLVDPEHAEITISEKASWSHSNYRYTEWTLIEKTPIYVLGQFVTKGSVDIAASTNEDVKALLEEWKKKPAELFARFDLDKNGQLDMQEWELARTQAKREIAAIQREARHNADLHTMQAPSDGRMYLISDLTEQKLAAKYRLWLWLHLAIFFGSLIAFAMAWRAS